MEGDHISLEVKVGEDCTVVVTTQASTKVMTTISDSLFKTYYKQL